MSALVTGPRTAEQEANYDAIGAEEVSDADFEAAKAFLARFPYTTTALLALRMAVADLEGDSDIDAGAELLVQTVAQMWDHEARSA